MFNTFEGRRVTVMGLGRFGGGVGAARYLAERGADVTVTDTKSEAELRESMDALAGLPVRFVLGGHDPGDFSSAHMVIVNPAVPRESDYVKIARDAGAVLTTEIGLFVERCMETVCGVTGSNGKSTTVSMIGAILTAAGIPHLVGGNLGGSLLDEVDTLAAGSAVVLELSSFQLEWLDEVNWSPRVACLLNIMPNHLDRHGSMERYRDIKFSILNHQHTRNHAVVFRDDPEIHARARSCPGKITWFGRDLDVPGYTVKNGAIARDGYRRHETIMPVEELPLPGPHNRLNALAAAACANRLGADDRAVREGLSSFTGLPHRLQFLGEREGVRFYNDSKATTPEAAAAAIESFERPVIPILGGYDKKTPFDDLARRAKGRVARAALIGDTAPLIRQAFDAENIPVELFDGLENAFRGCLTAACPGDVVLLSPACASYDMYHDFRRRGDHFASLVKKHIETG